MSLKLLVYSPALNEAATIGDVLDAIPSSIAGINEIEKVVIDDGSTDDTVFIARSHGARVVRHPRNLGTGKAFISGVNAALASGADIVVGIDSDGQFDPANINDLVEPIVTGAADVVLCTRFGDRKLLGAMPWTKRLGNRILTEFISFVAGQRFSDVSCGFRAFTRDAAVRVDIHSDFEYIHECLLNWRRNGLRIVEVSLPVLAERPVGKSRIMSSIVRYAWQSGPVLLRAVRDYSPFKFFGLLCLLAFVPSTLIGLGVFLHWCATGETRPFTSLITVSVGGVLLSFLLGAVALVADLIARLKFQVEELLYASRQRRYQREPEPN